MRTKYFNRLAMVIWAAIIAGGYIFLLNKTAVLSTAYFSSVDSLIRFRYKQAPKPKIIDRIVIVNIDEESLHRLHQRWPMNRDLYAGFLNKITGPDSRPSAVAMNISFIGASDKPEQDLSLAQALKEADNVILGAYLDAKGNWNIPEAMFADVSKGYGCLNYPRDVDYIIRRTRAAIFSAKKIEPNFILKTACLAQGIDADKNIYDREANLLKFLSQTNPKEGFLVPIDPKTKTTGINYFVKFNDFLRIPFWRVFEGYEPVETFKDKIVLLGTTTELLHDNYSTPLGLMPGMGVNANFLTSVLLNRYLKEMPARIYFIILLFVALIICYLSLRFGNTHGLSACLLFILSAYIIALAGIKRDFLFDFFGVSFAAIGSLGSALIFKYAVIIIEGTKLTSAAVVDPLTGFYIPQYCPIKLASEMRVARDIKSDLSLVIFDIDKFKEINDAYSDECGNIILKSFAEVLKKNSRPSDTICRDVGVKFTIILPRTPLAGAKLYVEKIKRIAGGLEIIYKNTTLKITLRANATSLASSPRATAQELLNSCLTDLNK